ncbi:MAG: hypothetical protein KKC68_05360 [Candidatus Thermoplasmatota archaeon]|nr:hypothetical protein [Candidatus Thermoplasmatota archaeon]MBU1941182.1 hypothetical protein [Candidatus Thermoplasmatota archaeon]
MTKNAAAMAIAVIAGILLLLSGVSGLAAWEDIKTFVINNITDNAIIQFVFAILIFIASLGGISVIAGGIFIGKEKIRTGKFFISIGAGLGLIGLLIAIIITLYQNSLTLGSFFSVGTIGLILSIAARMMTKKE